MNTLTYPEVLNLATQLPMEAQWELLKELWQKTVIYPLPKPNLLPLIGLNQIELRALAESVVAPERQKKLQQLLAQHRQGQLSVPQAQGLDELLSEVDQVALLKARALYTLKLLSA